MAQYDRLVKIYGRLGINRQTAFSCTFDTEVEDNFLNLNPSSAVRHGAAARADLKQALMNAR